MRIKSSAFAATLLVLSLLGCGPTTAFASANNAWAVTTGFSELLVLGPVSSALTSTWDITAHGPLHRALAWSAGARLAFGPLSPELFGRLGAYPRFGSWSPSLAVELGVSGQARNDQGDALLAELREQSRSDVVPLYVAMHAAPLRFSIWQRFSISVLELQLGTYVAPLGSFVRLQLGIISGGITL